MKVQANTTFRAGLWMAGVVASFSLMAIAGRELGGTLSTFEIMMYRSLVGLIIVSSVLSMTRRWHQVTRRSLGTHVIRNVAHFTGQNLWFYALTMIPLAQVFALEFTMPLWVIVLSPLVLGERLTPARALAALIGFAGILIVTRPSVDSVNIGIVTAASSAIFFAVTVMLTKRLTRGETTGCILFWLTLMQLVLGVAAVMLTDGFSLPGAQTAPWLLMVGLTGLMAHFCFANALQIAPATQVVPMDFVRLPAIAVIGMLLYQEALDIWVLVGAGVIFAGIYLNVLSETRRNRIV